MSLSLANTKPRTPPSPVALPLRADLIPASLRELPGWVTWHYTLRSGKWTKPPTRAAGKGLAKVNDPATWASFDAAAAAGPQDGGGGIGMVLTADLVGVDLDHVLDPGTGELEPWAAEVLTRFAGCYVERSPGGDGLHIFCRGAAVRSGKGGPSNRCEVYDKGSPRYLTVTGHRWGEGDVIDAQAALDWLHDAHMAKAAATPAFKFAAPSPVAPNPQPAARSLSDAEIIRMAHAARNGGKFVKLWSGDAGQDASAADAALVGMLAFFTQDAGQIDRLFRQSGLMRPKWDENRAGQTYGALTIGKVLAMPGARYSGPSTSAEPQGSVGPSVSDRTDKPQTGGASSVRLIRGDAVTLEPVAWLWPGFLPAGMLTILGGAPGCGKTTIALSLAATVTRGSEWPDGSHCTPPGDVLIWSGEDPASVSAARLAAAGADLTRVHFIEGLDAGAQSEAGAVQAFDPGRDMELLQTTASGLPAPRLLILDPIVSAVMGDSHKGAEVRRSLAPVVTLAQSLGCAVLGITHFSKGTAGRDPVERVTGSIAFAALARLVLVAAKVKPEPGATGEGRRVLMRAKSNIGPDDGGFSYGLERVNVAPGVEGVTDRHIGATS